MRKRIGISLILASSLAVAGTTNKTQQQLNAVNSQVKNAKSQLLQLGNQRQQRYLKLKAIEVKYGKIKNAYDKTQLLMTGLQQQIDNLTQEQSQLQAKLGKQYQALNAQIKAAYVLGTEPLFKMMLSEQDPNEINRKQAYLGYISRAQNNFIQKIRQTKQQLKQNQDDLNQQKAQMQQQAEAQQQRLKPLQQLMQQRQAALRAIDKTLNTKQQQLQSLLANQIRLSNLIAKIREQNSIAALKHKDFRKLKGQLLWPIKGKIIQKYQQTLANSKIRSDGIVIAAKPGTPIHAVAPGQVVFAEWMPGYGIVVIIRHNHGYMSIYGRNQAVYRKAGDVVSPGDIVATVGNTGGRFQPGLYFELRNNASPINPVSWLRKD